MNPSSDIGPVTSGESGGARIPPEQAPPANWREALMALIAARFALIELESKDTARQAARRVALIAAACGCALFGWALLLASGISLIADASGWSWHWVALAAAMLHLLAMIVLVRMATASAGPAFPVTRAEFQKDREWIENFHKTQKSND